MTVSQTTLIWRVKTLLGQPNDFQGTITASLTSGGTSVTVNDGTDWAIGDVVEWQDGDLAYVTNVVTNTLTISRGHLGATASAHNNGDVIYKNPAFYVKDIKDALDLTIKSLWPYVWKKSTASVTPDSVSLWYQLPADVIDVISLFQMYEDGLRVGVFGSSGNQKPFIVRHNLPDALTTTGVAVGFPNGTFSTDSILVNYRAKLDATTSTGSYTEFTDGTQSECIAYGAAARLAQTREASKVMYEDKAQGEVNTDSSDRLQYWGALLQKHIELRNNWADELVRTVPGAGQYR